jgi:hypothetical protein
VLVSARPVAGRAGGEATVPTPDGGGKAMPNTRMESPRYKKLATLAVLGWAMSGSSVAAQLTSPPPVELFRISSPIHDRQIISRKNPLPRSALSIFDFRFTNTDHHIKRIDVRNYDDRVELGFLDGDGNDPYLYRVLYRRIPDASIAEDTGSQVCRSRECSFPLKARPGYTFALSGFYLEFAHGDRHVKSVAIRPTTAADAIRVRLEDKNYDSDDEFHWAVQYVWIPDTAIQSPHVLRSFPGYGYQCSGFGSYNGLVLRGFEMTYQDGNDHHVRSVLAEAYEAQICGEFKDNDAGRRASIHIDVLELRP